MTTQTNELSKLEQEFEAKKANIELLNKYENLVGFKPSYISKIYGKTLLKFNAESLEDAVKIRDYFKPSLIPVTIRTATSEHLTKSPYYIEFKTWSFNGNKEAEIHFETEAEYIDIKIPFSSYHSDLLTSFEHNYEGEQAELRRYRRQQMTYRSYGLSGFDNMKFYGGSTKSYVKENDSPEHLEAFEKTIFAGKL